MSIAVLVNWLTNFAVGLAFPLMTTYNEVRNNNQNCSYFSVLIESLSIERN
jgi:hypothetical protein